MPRIRSRHSNRATSPARSKMKYMAMSWLTNSGVTRHGRSRDTSPNSPARAAAIWPLTRLDRLDVFAAAWRAAPRRAGAQIRAVGSCRSSHRPTLGRAPIGGQSSTVTVLAAIARHPNADRPVLLSVLSHTRALLGQPDERPFAAALALAQRPRTQPSRGPGSGRPALRVAKNVPWHSPPAGQSSCSDPAVDPQADQGAAH
jgi:hypothetical protein